MIVSTSAPESVAMACRALEAGELVVIPTDTVYGVAARLDRPFAIERLFDVKKRPKSKPIGVLVADLEGALTLGEFSSVARRRAEEGWPGAVTLVVPSLAPMTSLGGDGSTIGLRVPDHEWTLRLLVSCGPLAVTSANPTGMPTGVGIDDVVADLGHGVDLCVDGGQLDAAPSSVISLVGEPRKLR